MKEGEGFVKIYRRKVNSEDDKGILLGWRVHPILVNGEGKYYELVPTKKRKIHINTGILEKIKGDSRDYFKENPKAKPNEMILVNKKKFIEAIGKFKKRYGEKKYSFLNFDSNCIGFKKYVIGKSKVKN